MANEITLNIKLRFNKSNTDFTFAPAVDMGIDVTGTNFIHNRQTIGTSEEVLDLGDAGTGGYFVAINRDTTNNIMLRVGTAETDFIMLLPGEPCCFRLDDGEITPYAIAATANCELEYVLIEA